MRIEMYVSENNEGTSEPYWLILDPKQNMSCCPYQLAGQITGPYFSRESATAHLKNRHYEFSKNAIVYCMSGYWSKEYKHAIKNGT